MANSNDTKQAIRLEIERLQNKKRNLLKHVNGLKSKWESTKDRIDAITVSIEKLRADLG